MKAKLIQDKSFEKYEKKHEILEFQKILESFKTKDNIDEILKKIDFKPKSWIVKIKNIQGEIINLLTFSDEYIEDLKKFANK